ncbi:MAG: phosphoribosylformylglycinamidine synthase subunit PurQ, partial [Candidatus Nanoarchaeia archaeon]
CLRYCDEFGNTGKGFPVNPNGSLNDIAGICDETGRIFGLMPHPEAFLSPFNSSDWTRQIAIHGEIGLEGQGAIIFRNAVAFAQENLV